MNRRRGLTVVLVVVAAAGAAVGGYYAWQYAMETQRRAKEKADDIEEQLRELDPVTRAAVVARLSARARTVIPGVR